MTDAAPSPLTPLIARLGLLLLVAGLVTRALTSGGGIELLHPGAQLLFDALVVCGAAATLLGRGLAGRGLAAPPGALAAAGVCAVVLLVAAARAEHADLAWRTALSWTGLLLLLLVAHDLGRERAGARALVGVVVGIVGCAAGLALWQRLVEHPRLVAEYAAGALEGDIGHLDVSYRQALHERIHSPEAAGPFLLPALLACAAGMVLPLLVTGAWHLRRRLPWGPALGLLALVVAAAAAQTQSKGGALAVGAALGASLLLHPRVAPWRRRALAGLAVAGGVVVLAGLVAWARDPDAEGVGLSLAVRLEYWAAGLAIARDHPLLGAGLNQFRELYPAYKAVRAEEALHAHNGVVQLLAETGVVGLGAALGLLGVWARAGLRGLDARDAGVEDGEGTADGSGRTLEFTGAGLWLGLFLVASFGDAYSLETPGHLLALTVALPALAALGAWAADRAPPRLVAGALLAGVAAFLADALLDFGLHHAGTATVAALVLALGVARATPRDGAATVSRRVTLGLGLAAGGLGLALLALVVPRALEADQARARADEARDLDEAAADLAAATRAYPGHARTWLARAAVEARRGRLEDALRAAEAAVARAPRSASAWADLGAIRLKAGDLPGARAALEEAVRRYPGDPGHRLALGLALARDPAAPAAGEALDAALAASDEVRQLARRLTAEQVLSAARAHAGLGDAARAREAARRAVALDDAVRAAEGGPHRPLPAAARAEAERLARP
ncbi:MAG: O-antigen ligase family protein [Planctomycetes bacterium]|nr:O-antigen ligase family protein [Planctomycetota bacterium]